MYPTQAGAVHLMSQSKLKPRPGISLPFHGAFISVYISSDPLLPSYIRGQTPLLSETNFSSCALDPVPPFQQINTVNYFLLYTQLLSVIWIALSNI